MAIKISQFAQIVLNILECTGGTVYPKYHRPKYNEVKFFGKISLSSQNIL
jgi:hypothetical protein